MSNYSLNVSAASLRKAAAIQDKIEELNAQLEAILSGAAPGQGAPKKRGPKPGSKRKAAKGRGSKISAEGREKIRQAQLKRWAKQKKASKAKAK